jgi:hypothetical protein
VDYKTYNELWFKAVHQGVNTSKELGIKTERIELYQNFIFNHYQDALLKIFSRLDYLLELDWAEVTENYVKVVAPKAWDLNDFCLGFPKFFKENYPGHEKYFYELVEYEIAEFFVFKELNFDTASGFILNPVHRLMILNYDIAGWIQQMELTEFNNTVPDEKQNVLIIARDLKHDIPIFSQLTPLAIAIYNELQERSFKNIAELTPHILEKYGLTPQDTSQVETTIKKMQSQSIIS